MLYRQHLALGMHSYCLTMCLQQLAVATRVAIEGRFIDAGMVHGG